MDKKYNSLVNGPYYVPIFQMNASFYRQKCFRCKAITVQYQWCVHLRLTLLISESKVKYQTPQRKILWFKNTGMHWTPSLHTAS